MSYVPDQEAVDWARGCVEKTIAKYKGWEQVARSEGNDDRARRWRVVANVLQMELIGSGCVIGPFNEKAPKIDAMLAEIEADR
jgi:hypothetical protein